MKPSDAGVRITGRRWSQWTCRRAGSWQNRSASPRRWREAKTAFRIRQALNRIPAKHRRLLVDHFVSGQSTQQIARREGIPLGTVLTRIFTAKRYLRQAWKAMT